MVGAEGVGSGAASESRPKRGRNAADLARAGLLPLQPQVGFPVQLKLQMVRKSRKARRVPRAAPGAIADPLRDPAGLDYNGEPLPGILAEFAFLRGEHLACLRGVLCVVEFKPSATVRARHSMAPRSACVPAQLCRCGQPPRQRVFNVYWSQ